MVSTLIGASGLSIKLSSISLLCSLGTKTRACIMVSRYYHQLSKKPELLGDILVQCTVLSATLESVFKK